MKIAPSIWQLAGFVLILIGMWFGSNVEKKYAADGGFSAAPSLSQAQVALPIVGGVGSFIISLWPLIKPLIPGGVGRNTATIREVIAAVLRVRGKIINEYPELHELFKDDLAIIFGYFGYVPPLPPNPSPGPAPGPATGFSDEQMLNAIMQARRLEKALDAAGKGGK